MAGRGRYLLAGGDPWRTPGPWRLLPGPQTTAEAHHGHFQLGWGLHEEYKRLGAGHDEEARGVHSVNKN